ncbi:hypothetical protein C8A05DRAFT_39129 [Staphylotrichum tortipilum]|uniref:Uncharacterized protein n=1 Tax=Staphylotrichum tortipilum TaxID=2831512 RepID=A0AAN6RPE9_9PEZI|nr:hypothetical protein C8A05DRAFT_39129 [Staphylotrichum longicolle]
MAASAPTTGQLPLFELDTDTLIATRYGTLSLLMAPDPSDEDSEPAWVAFLTVRCLDPVRLMREAVFEGAVPREGWMSDGTSHDAYSWGSYPIAAWTLADERDDGELPMFAAYLKVIGQTEGALTAFRVEDLGPDLVVRASAYSPSGEPVYDYEFPDVHCNYEDEPLQG